MVLRETWIRICIMMYRYQFADPKHCCNENFKGLRIFKQIEVV